MKNIKISNKNQNQYKNNIKILHKIIMQAGLGEFFAGKLINNKKLMF